MSAGGVVVLSPSQRSAYTLSVAAGLLDAGIKVTGLCVRRLLSARRLREELQREGRALPRKIWTKLLGRGGAAQAATGGERSLRALARRAGIPLLFCETLNDPDVVEFLGQRAPELVVFTGGGILRGEVLARAGRGVVNCHMGFLPDYRGIDTALWAVLEGRFDKVGLSVHLMDEGIDTGPLLAVRRVALEASDTSATRLVARLESLMGETMVDACVKFLRGEIQPRPQRLEDGRQFFRLHSRLREIAEKKLAAHARRDGRGEGHRVF